MSIESIFFLNFEVEHELHILCIQKFSFEIYLGVRCNTSGIEWNEIFYLDVVILREIKELLETDSSVASAAESYTVFAKRLIVLLSGASIERSSKCKILIPFTSSN